MSVTACTYVRPGVVNMLRQFTGHMELCRADITRFATIFLTLQRMMILKNDLRKMSLLILGRKIYDPLVRVLRLVDCEKKPAMGYIYEDMDRTKKAIMKSFDKEDRYQHIFEMRMSSPSTFACYGILIDEVNNGFIKTVERLVPDPKEQDKISMELEVYHKAEGAFGSNMTKRQRSMMALAVWWETYGTSTPHLQKFVVKVLSLTCSSSGCACIYSLLQKRMNDLVFVKYNHSLKHDKDLVFEGDDLTRNVVGDALGVDEPEYQTRGKRSSTSVVVQVLGHLKVRANKETTARGSTRARKKGQKACALGDVIPLAPFRTMDKLKLLVVTIELVEPSSSNYSRP
ncbi:hypothetical protein ACS0TY_021643 [Phlomoides rotata]